MTLQASRKLARFNWVVLLSAVVLLACLTSAKTFSFPQHSLSANFDDTEDKRHLRTTDTWPVDNNSEDRAMEVPSWLRTVLLKLQKLIKIAKFKWDQWTANRLYKRSKAHKVVAADLLGSIQYQQWAAAVAKHFKYNRELTEGAIVRTLTAHHGDDGLRDMLNDAKKVSGIEDVVSSLEIAQLNYWVRALKSADDVFRWLKFDDFKFNILTNPSSLDTWKDFVVRSGNDKDPFELLFTELSKLYDERTLAGILVRATKDDNNIESQNRAVEVRNAKLQAWSSGKKTADDVYSLLRLSEEKELLESPALDMWVYYVQRLKENPEKLLFVKLQDHNKDAADLANAIIAAKQKHTTIIADELERELFEQWWMDKKSAKDIFQLLQLQKTGDESAAKKTWVSYVAFVKDKDQLTMFSNFLARTAGNAKTSATMKAIVAKWNQWIYPKTIPTGDV